MILIKFDYLHEAFLIQYCLMPIKMVLWNIRSIFTEKTQFCFYYAFTLLKLVLCTILVIKVITISLPGVWINTKLPKCLFHSLKWDQKVSVSVTILIFDPLEIQTEILITVYSYAKGWFHSCMLIGKE